MGRLWSWIAAGVVGLAMLGIGAQGAGADEGTNGQGGGPPAPVAGEAVQDVPEITAISPTWGPSGWVLSLTVEGRNLVFSLTVEGRNLTGASEVRFYPGTGIATVDSPVVNSEGTIATVKVTILNHAPLGPRLVVVRTPAGQSSLAPTEANIFKVSYAHVH
ncbi:MAG: hypothetical protein HZB35_01700 [Nitrospirae bacterium]|nr:hypothetical protein [Nitrospirota bacterium]